MYFYYIVKSVIMLCVHRIPQALVYFGAMKYSDSLMEILKKGEALDTGVIPLQVPTPKLGPEWHKSK